MRPLVEARIQAGLVGQTQSSFAGERPGSFYYRRSVPLDTSLVSAWTAGQRHLKERFERNKHAKEVAAELTRHNQPVVTVETRHAVVVRVTNGGHVEPAGETETTLEIHTVVGNGHTDVYARIPRPNGHNHNGNGNHEMTQGPSLGEDEPAHEGHNGGGIEHKHPVRFKKVPEGNGTHKRIKLEPIYEATPPNDPSIVSVGTTGNST